MVESKAAHLLYFVVKNHLFSEGNKRSGAFLFVDFLYCNGSLLNTNGEVLVNDTGLTALTFHWWLSQIPNKRKHELGYNHANVSY